MAKIGAQALSKNPNWKGGRTIASNGYVLIKMPDHPNADCRGYVYEHRLVAANKAGRALRPGEEAHHKNELKTDNGDGNIELKASSADHAVEHRSEKNKKRLRMPGAPNQTIACACGCGAAFLHFDGDGRPRRFVSGHNVTRNARGQFEVR